MSFFDFTRLIEKYSDVFTLVMPVQGQFEGGHYKHNGETKKTLKGAIIALSERKVYQSGGFYKIQDRVLYMTSPIEGALEGCKVIFDNNEYSIEEDTQNGNERYTGVSSYVLRWVSKLD